MIDGNDGGVDVTRRRRDLVRAARCRSASSTTSTADNRVPYHVSGRCRTSAPRRARATACPPAASTSATGTPSAAARPATPSSDPSDPNIVYAGEYGGILSRYDHRTRQARARRRLPDNPSGHGGEDGRYRFQWTAPIVVSPHDPEDRLSRRQRALPHHRRRADLDGDQPRPDAQRQVEAEVVGRPDHRRQHRRRVLLHDLRGRRVAEARACSGRAATTASFTSRATAARPGRTSPPTSAACPSGDGQPDRGLALRRRHRLRRRGRAPPGRHAAVPVQDDRLRPDVEEPAPPALPADIYLHAVREDPKRRGLLYLGTERGVMLSRDDGAAWQRAAS